MRSWRFDTRCIRWVRNVGCVLGVVGLFLLAAWLQLGGGSRQAVASEKRPEAPHRGSLVSGLSGVFDASSGNFKHMVFAGARFVHIIAPWGQIAPATQPTAWDPGDPGDPHYEWAPLDSLVTTAVDTGLTPVIMVSGAPQWAQLCHLSWTTGACNPNLSMFRAFAAALAQRYSGRVDGLPRVRYWQGLDEPNLSLFFDPQFRHGRDISPVLYRRLINAFYFAVKSVRKSNVVIAAGLGPVAVRHYTIGPMRFARELLCMQGRRHPRPAPGNCEGGVHFDIFDIHPYTTGGPMHRGGPDDVELGSLDRLQRLLAAADRAGRIKGEFEHTPLWATEFGWTSNPPNPNGLAMGIETRWTAEAMFRLWRARVSNVFWYQIRDPAGPPYQSGLYFRGTTVADDRPKPIMYAFRFPFVAYSKHSGFFFWGRTPTSEQGSVVIQARKSGMWRRVLVAHANRYGIFMGIAKGRYGRHRHGVVRARFRSETSVPFSLHPVKDFNQPPFGKPVG